MKNVITLGKLIGLLLLCLLLHLTINVHIKNTSNEITRVVMGTIFLIYIRECGSTLYVNLAHIAPPTNTNFRLTFLLTQLQEALYEDLPA